MRCYKNLSASVFFSKQVLLCNSQFAGNNAESSVLLNFSQNGSDTMD